MPEDQQRLAPVLSHILGQEVDLRRWVRLAVQRYQVPPAEVEAVLQRDLEVLEVGGVIMAGAALRRRVVLVITGGGPGDVFESAPSGVVVLIELGSGAGVVSEFTKGQYRSRPGPFGQFGRSGRAGTPIVLPGYIAGRSDCAGLGRMRGRWR